MTSDYFPGEEGFTKRGSVLKGKNLLLKEEIIFFMS